MVVERRARCRNHSIIAAMAALLGIVGCEKVAGLEPLTDARPPADAAGMITGGSSSLATGGSSVSGSTATESEGPHRLGDAGALGYSEEPGGQTPEEDLACALDASSVDDCNLE